ncbi:putative cysteine peptidase [Mesomycoplasma flocculare]|uniref:Uncharacterized protein n=1 Tax=Mesomycoplasma flocculare ATCC 27399 TaxID=743971 RepID=A0A0A8EC02_MESFC|nr:C10 family peptidase [Mesomycoplasma flocculare]AJC49696.1 hypothetical protein MYF_00705 [Mesomycoplasma flocculare ATCC 27399]ENX51087.1 hypothetical protein MFC_00561 [Mesomycoplasma flocculare ATCC 27716]
MINLIENVVVKAEQNNKIPKQQIDYFIKTAKVELLELTDSRQDFLYCKILKNIYGQSILFLQFTNFYLVITLENYETNEIANFNFDEKLFKTNNVVYIPGFSLHYRKGEELFGLISKQKLDDKIVELINKRKDIYLKNTSKNREKNKEKRDKSFNSKTRLKRGIENPNVIAEKGEKIENLNSFNIGIPNSWWFKAKDSNSKLGYIEYEEGSRKVGVCEYIAMALMLEYAETFIASGIFTNEEVARFFDVKTNYSSNLSDGVAEYKYYKHKNSNDGTSTFNSLPLHLFELNEKYENVKYASYFTTTLESFLKDKEIKKYITTDYSTSFMHSSSPENFLLKNQMPVMVAFANFSVGHNIIIYGYDPKTEKYLVNFGWENYSNLVISKWDIWSFWSLGYWWSFKIDDDYKKKHPPKQKLLSNNGQIFSYSEISENDQEINRNGNIVRNYDIY